MSFVDLIGILLIVCLCYIGYLKGIKGKTFFLISFALSALLMYFTIDAVFLTLAGVFSSFLVSVAFVVGFFILPVFILVEFFLKKLLSEEVRSFSSSKKNISQASRILGAFVGFAFGFVFMFLAISLTAKNSKKDILFELPEFVEKSIFYKIAVKPEKNEVIKQNNLKTLSFFYNKEAIETFKLSQEEVVIIFKMIKGISNEKANELLQMKQVQEKQEALFLKLKTFYEEELEVIEEKYKSEEAEIEILFERFKPKKSSKKITPKEQISYPQTQEKSSLQQESKPKTEKKNWFGF